MPAEMARSALRVERDCQRAELRPDGQTAPWLGHGLRGKMLGNA
jgi:hypothetical protein